MAENGALTSVQSILPPEETITPESPLYNENTQPWASQKQQNPRLVVRPQSVESLSRVIAHLYNKTNLDFVIRGHGFMSASARDVVVSMTAFDEFQLDQHSERVTVGAGQTWRDVYQKLEGIAPQYGIIGARTPCVGVAGTILSGGFSWISAERGCISDPENMLDAEVVKHDGSVIWASSEPELLWSLRGGGGGFAVVTRFILRVIQYPQNIWTGPILIPRTQLPQLAHGLALFVSSNEVDPKVTMLLYVVKKKLLASIGTDQDTLVVHVFDGNGEEHGRRAFQWALGIPGAIDQTTITGLRGVTGLQDKADSVKGTMKQFWAPVIVKDISEKTILNSIKWFEDIERLDPKLGDCTYLIFELLTSRDPIKSPISSCAWPRPTGTKHIILLGTGCPAEAGPEQEKLVHDLAMDAPATVLGENVDIHILPNAMEDFHDPRKIWTRHFPKLQELKRKYDPRGRFKGAISE